MTGNTRVCVGFFSPLSIELIFANDFFVISAVVNKGFFLSVGLLLVLNESFPLGNNGLWSG